MSSLSLPFPYRKMLALQQEARLNANQNVKEMFFSVLQRVKIF